MMLIQIQGEVQQMMEAEFDFVETLDCGCEKELDVNGKWQWYLCDEHDEEAHREQAPPPMRKYRKSLREND